MVFSTNCESQKSKQKEQQAKKSQQTIKQDTAKSSLQAFDFEKCQTGTLPQGWETGMTGKGTPGKWEVAVDKTKKVENKGLAQTSMKNFG